MISISALVLVLLTSSFGDTIIRDAAKKKGAGPLFQIRHGRNWGFIDRRGNIVIAPKFDDEGDFFDGLARVQNDGKWGYVDETGDIVIPYEFYNAGDFSEGLAPVQLGRLWAFIDVRGRFVIHPQYQAAAEFRDGLARFEVWDTIDCDGGHSYTKEDAGLGSYRLHDFMSVTAAGHVGCLPPRPQYGFVDKHGNTTIAAKFLDASDFSEGLAAVRVDPSTPPKYGYIDKTGKIVIPPEFDEAYPFSEGLARVMVGFLGEAGKRTPGKFGFIGHEGHFVIPPRFPLAGNFSEGLAGAYVEGSGWGFLDRQGVFVISPRYDEARDFSDGVALVCDHGCYYIDETGKKALSLEKWAQWPFVDGLTVSGPDGQRKYVDHKGRIVGPYEIEPR